MARARGRKVDATGRSAGFVRHVRLDHWIFDCAVYRRLKPGPRALLWELIRRFNGSNNGRIGMGVRAAGTAVGVDPGTVGGYFHKLEAEGFIVATRRGAFNMKAPTDRIATEWRLTWLPSDGQAPTKDFMRACESNFDGVEIPVPKYGKSTPAVKQGYSNRPEQYA